MTPELEKTIRSEAQAMFDRGASEAEYSSRIFGPEGLLRQLWSSMDERRRLMQSPLFRDLQDQMHALEVRGATPSDPDANEPVEAVNLSLPRSLHASLLEEAKAQSVSLSELVRRKLRAAARPASHGTAGGKRETGAA